MALTTAAALVAAMVGPMSRPFIRATPNAIPTGGMASLWTFSLPTAGGTPTANTSGGDIPTTTTVGALPFIWPGSNSLYIAKVCLGFNATTSLAGITVMVYDRLYECSGFSGTVATAQTITSPAALTRYTSGVGVQGFLEWYTATGSTATTATVSYTNQAGSSGQTSPTITLPASIPAGSLLPIPLATGDTGIQSVQSVTLAASTLTAGNFGITLAYPLTQLMVSYNLGASGFVGFAGVSDYLKTGLPSVQQNACIWLAEMNSIMECSGTIDLVNQ